MAFPHRLSTISRPDIIASWQKVAISFTKVISWAVSTSSSGWSFLYVINFQSNLCVVALSIGRPNLNLCSCISAQKFEAAQFTSDFLVYAGNSMISFAYISL